MELKAMNEMAMDDELLHSDALAQVTIKQYFQDLYRFYKLHPLKAEFEDIFALPPDIYETQFFRLWIEDMSVFRNLGEYFFAKNYYVEALHVFRQIVEKSNNYELYEKIGYCYQQLGDFGNALANYHKAELLDKNRFWLINHIAYCFRKLGEFPKALEYYHEAEKFSPEDLGIQASLGQVYMETGNFETALKFYFKVEYLQPENHKVLRPISWCSFMLGKFDNALKYIEKSLQNHVTKNDLLNLGHIHWCMGNTMKASESYLQGYQKSNFDAEWFSRVMLEDGKYLQKFEVDIFDLPLMIDYVLLQG
jgi:tetratricopeptide (TPR) repeat protein